MKSASDYHFIGLKANQYKVWTFLDGSRYFNFSASSNLSRAAIQSNSIVAISEDIKSRYYSCSISTINVTGCFQCKQNYFSESEQSLNCSACPLGTMNEKAGSTYCESCKFGSWNSYRGGPCDLQAELLVNSKPIYFGFSLFAFQCIVLLYSIIILGINSQDRISAFLGLGCSL
jgi:hypothetical protein